MDKEISVVDAAKSMQQDKVVLLDVREHSELDICRIEEAIHIPLNEIPQKTELLPRNLPLIIFCHHGMRSRSVVDYLRSIGFDNVLNMTGGIHCWSKEINPKMQKY